LTYQNKRDEILRQLLSNCISNETFKVPPNADLTKAQQAIDSLLASEIEKTVKAFGGCRKCYGKGYSTWRHGETYRGSTKNLRNDIKYCTCERGKQLQEVIAEEVRKARVEDTKKLINRIECGEFGSYIYGGAVADIYKKTKHQLAELQLQTKQQDN